MVYDTMNTKEFWESTNRGENEMTNFLPYAIIAGIVIVFFVVCYVLYSGGNHEEEVKKEKKPVEKNMEKNII